MNGDLVFWVVCALFFVACMLFIAVVYFVGWKARNTPWEQRQPPLARMRPSVVLYLIGIELFLVLPLAASMKQTLAILGVVPQHLPSDTIRWLGPLYYAVVLLVIVLLGIGFALDWRKDRSMRPH